MRESGATGLMKCKGIALFIQVLRKGERTRIACRVCKLLQTFKKAFIKIAVSGLKLEIMGDEIVRTLFEQDVLNEKTL